MENLTGLPNIGKTLASKLISIGITNKNELIELGSENAIIRIGSLENSGACLNMLFALEGAIQGIRWHSLNKNRKEELKTFFQLLQNSKG